MVIEKKGVALIMFVSVLFLICYSANTHLNIGVYAQVLENTSDSSSNRTSSANLTDIQNVTDSNTNSAIPYVLNVTNSSDTTSEVVDQVIQAISGGQSTSLQDVLNAINATSKGNISSSSIEQVIDAASSALNNQTTSNNANNASNNITSGLP
jgi:hypothetical protein